MSYNIDNFKIKEIKNFKIPDIYKILHSIKDYEPEIFEIDIDEETDEIKDISLCGKCSGSFWHDTFENILKTSTGYLKALMVWEGGDTIAYLEINNGIVEYKEL